jgi:uncharacterized membrane-anchored protein
MIIEKLKKFLMVAAVIILIWAIADPGSAADFVHFLWLKIQDGLSSLISFLRSVFHQ